MSNTHTTYELTRNAFGRLVLQLGNAESHTGVVPVRAFPIGAPDLGVSLVSTDGRELLWIADLKQAPRDIQTLLEEELAARDFVPQILSLHSVSTYSTPSIWRVTTDRGDTQLVLKGEEDIRRLGHGELLITSGEGVLFRISDMRNLEKSSRRLLERFL